MRLEHNAETHQLVLWTMGPAHVDKLLTALRESWHVQVEVEPVRTSLRETFLRPTSVQGRLVKQSGGHGQYAVCQLEIEPLERGAGFEFAERVVGGAVPRQFIPSVEKGIRNQLAEGRAGRLPGGRRPGHPGRRQGALGRLLRHGVPDRGGHRAARGGQRVDRGPAGADRRGRHHRRRGLGRLGAGRPARPPRAGARHRDRPTCRGYIVIHAEVPAHELSRYPIDLRSVSHGTGTFTRRFVRYDYMPARIWPGRSSRPEAVCTRLLLSSVVGRLPSAARR